MSIDLYLEKERNKHNNTMTTMMSITTMTTLTTMMTMITIITITTNVQLWLTNDNVKNHNITSKQTLTKLFPHIVCLGFNGMLD